MSASPLTRCESAEAFLASHPSYASSHSGSMSPFARTSNAFDLPPELLRHIFLYCDPATLYTTVRGLNRSWKDTVEKDLIPTHFTNRDWRVGLRVVRKLPSTLPESELAEQHPQNGQEQEQEHVEQRQRVDDDLYRLNVLNRPGARELYAVKDKPRTITHVIPLSFKGYDSENVSLRFDTDSTWHSIFQVNPPESDEEGDGGAAAANNADDASDDDNESDESSESSEDENEEPSTQAAVGGRGGGGAAQAPVAGRRRAQNDFGAAAARARARAESARLEVDFGLVWRFPDDGQDADVYDIKHGDADSWGQPDPENGWLSRFYCSNFDTVSSEPPTGNSSPAVLQSTPLTRRVRSSRLHSAVERRMHDIVDDDEGFSPAQMIWSDEGHEYMSLDLSLGMEFFVRRSARANQLVRRLEAAAADVEARDVVQQLTRKLKKGKKAVRRSGFSSLNPSVAHSAAASGWATPLEIASPPPSRITASTDPRRRALQNSLERDVQKDAAAGPSSSSPLKGKAAARSQDEAEDEDEPVVQRLSLRENGSGSSAARASSASATAGTSTPEQPASAPSFLAPSMLVSRFNSVAPSRQGGGSVGTGSSYGTKSRSGKSGSIAPRATFQAKLLRAERMPSRPSSPPPPGANEAESSNSTTAANTPSDRAGWTGGDKFGRGAYRLAQEWSEERDSDKFQEALSNSGVTTPVTWTWSRG